MLVKVNLPEDMTEVYKLIGDFQANIILEECKKNNINAESVIKYLESNRATLDK